MYAFGFLFMLPQLFVNYKVRRAPGAAAWALRAARSERPAPNPHVSRPQMKSVAHLPWKAFTYKVSALPGAAAQAGATFRARGGWLPGPPPRGRLP